MADPAQAFHPEHIITEIAEFIGDPVRAAEFPEHIVRWRNDMAAATVGLAGLSDSEWIAHFGRFEPLTGSLPEPLALRYHGHQFRNYNPDIGDGRGFLFAQMRDGAGRIMDLGTKGSGTTPYSRFGDGGLTLKGGVREILATEMLEALGVETSRTFSLIETGLELHRGDEPSPTRSAVMVRLSHGHIRIGSFQRLATLGQHDALHRLVAYALKHYYGEDAGADAPARLLALVAGKAARLAASYMAAGFVHGVLNTDNINITAESFDYGPWRFAQTFDPGFTAAYFDSAGLYAFGRQAEAIHWNVVQLAIALNTIAEVEPLAAAVDGFAPAYRTALVAAMLWRLGVAARDDDENIGLVQAMEAGLIASRVNIDRFFFDWAGGDLRAGHGDYAADHFAAFRDAVAPFASALDLADHYWSDAAPCGMAIEEVEAIWQPIADGDDWSPLDAKAVAIRRMGAALANRSRRAKDMV
ncbi:protein adenylyltransferase SelO family protein [Sphingomonas sp.]|uniref:protein adenylyltransferase SelO family protein n=1 Tax=Sphingomonas sp. TaxID=28214 RepID=UPI0025EE1A9F|nr:YdiU family protein [Sphingomonas sp.]